MYGAQSIPSRIPTIALPWDPSENRAPRRVALSDTLDSDLNYIRVIRCRCRTIG